MNASKNRFQPSVEALENRTLMAASLTSSLDARGVFRIEGTDGADAITVRQVNGSIWMQGGQFSYRADQVKLIVVDGRGGNDTILLNSEAAVGQQPILAPAIVDGGAGADVIVGTVVDDQLIGGADNDSLYGSAGNDVLSGGDGSDYIDTGDGSNIVYGGAGNDTIYGGNGLDFIMGDLGDDTIVGRGGDDLLGGGDGSDRIWGEAGRDVVAGDSGDDSLCGGDGNDVILGEAGNDGLWGGLGDDLLDGSTGYDYLYGNEGNDILFDITGGGVKSDTIGQNSPVNGYASDDLKAAVILPRVMATQAAAGLGVSSALRQVTAIDGILGSYQGGASPLDPARDVALGVYMQTQWTDWISRLANNDVDAINGINNLPNNPFINGSYFTSGSAPTADQAFAYLMNQSPNLLAGALPYLSVIGNV